MNQVCLAIWILLTKFVHTYWNRHNSMKVAQRYFKRGNSKIISKDYAGAITFFDKGIENNPKFAWAYLNRGIAKNFSIDSTESSICVTANLEIDQVDSFSNYDPGIHSSFRSQISPLVIADFDKAIEINPWFSKAYFSRGLVRSGLDNHSIGFANREKYLLNLFNDEKPFQRNVTSQDYWQDHSDVIADFDRAIEIDPEFAQAYYTRAISKNYFQHTFEKTSELIRIKESNLNLTATLPKKNLLQENQFKDFDGAISDFDKAIVINPGFSEAYYCRGLAKNYMQGPAFKIRNLPGISGDKTEETSESHGEELPMIGQLKDYQSIISDFDMAIKINPKHAKAYCSRGLVKIFCEDQWEILNESLLTNDLDADRPKDSDYGCAASDFNFKNYSGAIADFDKAVEINPRFANAYYYRGISKYYCGDHSGAVIDCKKAIEIDPAYAEDYNKSILSASFPRNPNGRYLN